MKQLLLFLSLLLCQNGFAQEAEILQPLQGVTFKRQSLGDGTYRATKAEKYPAGTVTMPAWPGSAPSRGYLTHQLATPRPAGATIMWATFSFKSKGMFTAAPGAHALFIVRSLSTGLSNIGQGFIVGGLSGITQSEGGPCAAGIRSQPEVWHENPDGSAGNRVYGGSYCSPVMQDWAQYNVMVHATPNGYAYWITEALTGYSIASNYISTATSPSLVKQEKASGFTVGIVFADAPWSNWEFEVTDLVTGWF